MVQGFNVAKSDERTVGAATAELALSREGGREADGIVEGQLSVEVSCLPIVECTRVLTRRD